MNDRLSKLEATLKTYRKEWEEQTDTTDKIIAASSYTTTKDTGLSTANIWKDYLTDIKELPWT